MLKTNTAAVNRPDRRRAFLPVTLLALAVATLAGGRAAAQAVTRAAIITTVAGNGTPGNSGIGGQATAAELVNPTGVAVDANGNIFIAQPNFRRIFKVSSTGVYTVYAGTGAPGSSGDGGPATSAKFRSVALLTVDAAGNLYIPDQTSYNVRKITASTGIITTVAGNGTGGFSGDGGVATAAQLGGPSSVAFDGAGNMYIADTYGNRIRKVAAATGIISTVAGNGTAGYVADGVQATTTQLNTPTGVAVDAAGNIYIGDTSNQRIRKVAVATGLISTIAGDGTAGYLGDAGQAASAELNYPSGVALDAQGHLAIADRGNNVVRSIDLSTGIITTAAGAGTGAYSGDDGLAVAADLNYPFSVAFDPFGNLFIADYFNNVIRRVNPTLNAFFPDTAVGSTSASVTMPLLVNSNGLQITGVSVPVSQGGLQEYIVTGDSCALNTPLAMGTICTVTLTFSPGYPGVRGLPLAVATSGGGFRFGLRGNGLGPQIGFTPAQIVTTVGAYPGGAAFAGDGGPATAAKLSFPLGTVSDFAGNLYISDASNSVVRRVDAITGLISTYAGIPSQQGSTGDGGPATSAKLKSPRGLALDSVGNLYFADCGNHAVRKVDAITGNITTVAGTLGTFGSTGNGGQATSALLRYPNDVALDAAGNLYIADTSNNVIREVTAATGIITTFAGTLATSGYSGDNGPATSALLLNPNAVALDSAGNLYIDDNANNVFRKVTASTGIITTAVGMQGAGGYSGNGGAATSALLYHPFGVALDSANNLYIADSSNSDMREVNAATGIINGIAGIGNPSAGGYSGDGGPATAALLYIPGLPSLDSAGALYISDYVNSVVRKVAGPPSLSFAATNVSAAATAQDITVTNNGTAALTLSALTAPADFNLSGADTTCTASTSLAPAQSCVLGVVFQPASAGSHSEVLTLVDNQGTQTIPLAGTGVVSAQTITFTAPSAQPLGGTLVLSGTASSGLAIAYTSSTTGVCTVAGNTATFVTLGTCVLIANQAGNAAYSAATAIMQTIAVTQPTAYTAPASPVGIITATQSAYVTFTAPGILNAIHVLTLGAPNLDFKLVAGGTCSVGATYTANQSCTVMYSFTPAYPGQRRGAITLTDSSAALLGASSLSGLGNGPLAVFSGNQQLSIVSTAFTTPHGMAVDASGNLFVPDTGTNMVYEVLAGTSTLVPLAATNGNFSQPTEVALDGAGNVYVADSGNNAIKEIVAASGYVTVNTLPVPNMSFTSPQGVAVDGAGNVFVADYYNNAIKEILASGGYTTVVTLAPTTANLNGPQAVGLDGAGNVLVADANNNLVKMIVAPGYTTVQTLGSGLSFPQGVAADARGNVYVSDAGNGAIKEILAAGGYVTTNLLVGYFANGGVAVDGGGNVFIAQSGVHTVAELSLTTAPSLSFATTAVGLTSSDSPQTVTIVNNGNAALAFSALAPSSNHFSLTGSACSIGNPVAAGLSCALALSFTPQSVGSLSGSAVLTDNSLQPSATQSIALTGTGTIGSQTITFAGPGSQMFGAPLTLTATASSGLLVIFSSSTPGVCSVASGTVTFLSTGSCSITATQPGNANYTAASTVTRSFSVVPGGPTITFSVPPQTFGAVPFTVAASSNSTGAITYSVVSGPATVSGNTVTLTGVGTVVLLATQAAAGNYLGSTQSVTVNVLGATPTIAFAVAAQTFGAVPFTVAATSNSNGAITYSVVSGPATLSGNTVTLTGAGTVVLLATQAAAGSYAAGTQSVTFIVAGAVPAISFTVAAQTFGAAPFPVTATSNSTGAITYSVVSGPATLSGNTVTLTGAGTVVLLATQAAGGNYAAGTQSVTFTVADAIPTIHFAVAAQAFGAAPFAVSATSNSTGAVTYSVVSGPATLSGNTVTLTGAGTVVLLCTQAAAGSYLATTQSVTFVVAAENPTLTFSVVAQTFGAAPFAVAATSNSPGAITYSVVSGPATLSGNTVTLTGPGTVVLLASQAATANYSTASQTATFTVTSGTPTVTAAISPASLMYGQAATITVTETAAGSPVAGATATVTVGGQVYTCTTNASGVCAVTVPGGVLSGGSNPVAVSTAAAGSVTAGAFQFMVTVGPAPTTLTLGSSSTQVTVDNPVTLTATVASPVAGTPTGTVIFDANGTSIGTGTVTGGVASLTLSTLAVGANAISATYGGDSNFLPSMASGFTQTVVVNFTISPGSGSGAAPPVQTVPPGGTAVFPLSLGIINGFVGPVTMSATGLPPGATVTFTPAVIQLDGIHPGNTTMSIATSAPVAQAAPDAKLPGSRIRYGWILLPMLALGGMRRRRMSWTSLLLLGVCGLGISGCGSGGYFGAAPSSYVITVTASSGNLQHSTTVTLTIQ